MKQVYYKYTRTINGGWLKEPITKRVYPLKLNEFDLIILRDTYCWEIREANTFIGLVTGYSPRFKTRNGVIAEAERILAEKTPEQIKGAKLYADEYKIKFRNLPINQEIMHIGDFLTQSDIEEISALYN